MRLGLPDIKKVHMVGIKGTGMSALALLLRSLGIEVSGSDAKDSFLLLKAQHFADARITIAPDFDKKNITADLSAVISSSSHGTKNLEIKEAKKLGLPVLTYADIVALLSRSFPSIAVCGSHGKTTTTNLLAHVLQQANIPILPLAGPTSEQVLSEMQARPLPIGKPLRSATARVRDASAPADDGVFSNVPMAERPLFVFEADEYQNKLKQYSPLGVILTNIELDHPDYFKTKAQYKKVFIDFIKKIPPQGFLIDGREYPYELGRHMQFNEHLVTLAAHKLGLTDEQIRHGIATFTGSPRRMQKVSEHPLIYDDYGHHPTEIKTTLRALRERHPDKTIWTVFHPHTFTRTKAFLKEFGDSFADSDHTIVLEIWGSAREKHGTVSSRDIVDIIRKKKGKADYAATFDDAAALLKGKLTDTTLLLTIGAGDVWKLHKLIL